MNGKQFGLLGACLAVTLFVIPNIDQQSASGEAGFFVSNKELGSSVNTYNTGYVSTINNKDYFLEVKKSQERLADEIYEYGKEFLGLDYVWGGTTPKGFDCSGFMQYIYGEHGVDIPRTASEQYKDSIHIQPNQARKGDLVFFYGEDEDADKIVHVGMYLGRGKFLQSGGPSDDVNESTVNIYGKSIVFGRVL